MAARKKKAVNELYRAIDFVSLAQKAKGLSYQQHTAIADGYAVATDGILTAGHPVTTDVAANAHTRTLRAALAKCGEKFSVTYYENDKLKVKSNRFSATVECLPPDQMLPISHDANIAAIDERLIEAFNVLLPITSESATTVLESSILVNPGSAAATNKSALIEFWHGIDLPPNMVIPRLFAATVAKVGEAPIGFGYSGRSITFHYENGSFIKTQLYQEKWPDITRIIGGDAEPSTIPEDLLPACKTLAEFSDNGALYSFVGKLCSHPNVDSGASVEVEGVPEGLMLDISNLEKVLPHVNVADFNQPQKVFFFGGNVRAVVSKGKP